MVLACHAQPRYPRSWHRDVQPQASPRDLNSKVTKPGNTPTNHTMSRQLCHSVTPLIVFFLIVAATIPVSASSSSLFCKCSCLTNSTLIPISGPDSSSPKTCTDCNRQFCRDYNLPFCKGVEYEDISTTCFRMFLICPYSLSSVAITVQTCIV